MKKIISLILALMLVLCMGAAAFAEGDDTTTGAWDGTYTPTTQFTFEQIKKTYSSENNVVVNETLRFTSEALSTNPDTSKNLTVADLVVSSLTPANLVVTVPSLDKAGVYEWIIKETAGTTAGVTYSTNEIHVIVLVEYNNTDHKLQIKDVTSYIKKINDEKTDTFENTFKSGSFTVAKNVTGNMANENDEFEITVTLTSTKPIGTTINVAGNEVAFSAWTENNGTYTYTFTTNYSKIGGAKTFTDIPEGVTVSVVENTINDKMNGYTYTSTNTDTTNTFSMTVADADANKAVVVTNNKTTEIDMGVSTDSLPYIVLLGIVALIGAAMIIKRRATND